MNEMICPNTPKCPIFNGVLKGTEYTSTYRNLYCEAGEDGRKKCRRFQVASIMGRCPEKILPNSTKTVEEIIEAMKKEALKS